MVFGEFIFLFNIFTGLATNNANKKYISHSVMCNNIPKIVCVSFAKGIIYEAFFPITLIGIFISFIIRGNINSHIIPGLVFSRIDYGPYVETYKFIKHK